MQPIIVFAIVGVAAIALGTGFLNNDIDLWIQDFGVGSGNIELPADHAIIDFNIIQIPDDSTGFFKNRIDKCIVTLDAAVGNATNANHKDSEITCKITGKDTNWNPNGKVITEGKICAPAFAANTPYMIFLGPQPQIVSGCNPATTNPVFGPSLIDPKAAGDVILVVHANTYNNGQNLP